MIYKYYCMDCGVQHEGKKFNVDLTELLELRDASKTETVRAAQISIEKLRELAKKTGNGKDFKPGETSEIKLSLFQLLDFMLRSSGKLSDADIQERQEQWNYYNLGLVVESLFSTNENVEVEKQQADQLKSAMEGRFTLEMDAEEVDLHNYYASFWVKPVFFDGTNEIYTIRYSADEHSPNFKSLMCIGGEIRGYCPNPECGKPILRGTGLYPHIMVGMLGAQSSGKTTTIVSMMQYLKNHYSKLGLKSYPDMSMADSKDAARKRNLELYRMGWAVMKTDAETAAASFNASFLIDDPMQPGGEGKENGKKLLSLVDIAGELCWDNIQEIVNPNAWQTYPLINSCDAYVLCTCMDAGGYGNADGDAPAISPESVLKICQSIYANRRETKLGQVPPLCILLTKVDLADSSDEEGYGDEDDNGFDRILPSDTEKYQFIDDFNQLKSFYNMYQADNVRIPLDYCCHTFDEMKRRTYVTMLYCSALGRTARKYPDDKVIIDPCQDGAFKPNRLDRVWSWIFKTIGVVPAEKDSSWYFSYVPSFTESYITDGEPEPDANPRRVYTVEDSYDRIQAVQSVYLNMSDRDGVILNEWADGVQGHWPRKSTPEQRIRKLL